MGMQTVFGVLLIPILLLVDLNPAVLSFTFHHHLHQLTQNNLFLMDVQLFNPLLIFAHLREDWENLMWQCSQDRQQLATVRLAAHELAMKEGYQSPYTDPDDYDLAWNPLVKRHRHIDEAPDV